MGHRRRAVVVVSALIAGLCTGLPAVAKDSGPPGHPGLPAAEAAAAARAHASGQRVEVVERRSETEQVFANPARTFTASIAARPVRVHRTDGSWVPVDSTLRAGPDGAVAPAATPMDLRLSGGGTGPLVTMTRAGRSVALTWPGRLPTPALAGDTATYAEVRPGVDVRVRATPDGFSDVLVVKTAAAAADPTLRTVHFGLSTVGVTAAVGKSGELSAVDSTGRPWFSAPPAMMWDSSGAASPAGAAAAGTASAREPGARSRQARMAVRLSGGDLVVVPDRRLLSTARFPLFIDPETTYNLAAWTEVNAYRPGSVWRTTDNRPAAGHAYDGLGTYTVRSFLSFPTTSVRGAHIFSAFFRVYLIHSWSCQPRPVELWALNGGFTENTTWNSQPSWSGAQWQSTLNVAKGYTGCAAGQISFAATKGVARGAAAGAGSIVLGLKAANESDVYGWKKFEVATASVVPQLDVSYDFAPNPLAAKDLSTTDPRTSCVTAPANAPHLKVPSSGMMLRARPTDPDGTQNKLVVNAEWYRGSTRVGAKSSSQTNPGNPVNVKLTLPAGSPDGVYSWRANVQDINPDTEQVMSTTAWSPSCYFVHDSTAPKPPVVSSPSYPDGDAADDLTAGVGRAATFMIDPNGSTDVVRYYWSLGSDRGTGGTPVTASGSQPVTFVLTPDEPNDNRLFVMAVDVANNHLDDSTEYDFSVPGGVAPPAVVLPFDDDAMDQSGDNWPAQGSTIDTVPGKVGNAGHFDGNTFVTVGPAIDTATNFSISAWVRLAATGTSQTAVSLFGTASDGDLLATFSLGYDASAGKWSAGLITSSTAAKSAAPAVAGRWTQLTATYEFGPGRIRLFVDGQLAGTGSASPGDWTTVHDPQNVGVGALYWEHQVLQPWVGEIDELRAWDRYVFPMERSLLGQWDLDNRSGADTSGYGHDLTAAPNAAWGPDAFGFADSALTPSGHNNQFLSSSGPLLRTDSSFTVAAYVYITDRTLTGTALCQLGVRHCPFYLEYRAVGAPAPADQWTVSVPAADADSANVLHVTKTPSPPSPPTGTASGWTQLVVTYDAPTHTYRLYTALQGIAPTPVGQITVPTAWNSTGALNIGRGKYKGAANDYWNGGIDNVRIWGDVLTTHEISSLA